MGVWLTAMNRCRLRARKVRWLSLRRLITLFIRQISRLVAVIFPLAEESSPYNSAAEDWFA